MQAPHSLTDRQAREREYYDQYARLRRPSTVNFAPIEGRERRPWNSYWYVYERLQSLHQQGARRLLDFGCGPGHAAILAARIGYEAVGFDISPGNIAVAEDLAGHYGLRSHCRFLVGAAESPDLEAGSFDVVLGFDILHHVSITDAIRRTNELLAPGGTAIFHEPVIARVFDAVRSSAFGKWLVPTGKSLERHVTEDERKLNEGDIATIKAVFPNTAEWHFRLFSRLDKFVRNASDLGPSTLEKVDRRLLSAFPSLRKYAGGVVFECRR